MDEILREADILLASIGEFRRESQPQEVVIDAGSEDVVHQTPETNDAAADAESGHGHAPIEVAESDVANVVARVALDDSASAIHLQPLSNQRTHANTTNTNLDDSVVIIGGAEQFDTIKPIGRNEDEDVIFVTEVRQPYRTLATIDLCDSPKPSMKNSSAVQAPSTATDNNNKTPSKCTAAVCQIGTTKCPICLDVFAMDQILSTMCGHLFCGPCIHGVIKTRKKCPMCNRGLKPNQVHRIFVDPD